VKETVADKEKAAPETARDVETPTAVKEAPAPAAMPPHATADQQHQATAEAPAMTEAAALAPVGNVEKPAETVIAPVAKLETKPETLVPDDAPAKQAEPLPAAPTTTGSAATAAPAAEHKE
jgi:hypothetical protein